MIYKGIIFSNESSKGDALVAFLEHLNYVPTEIVFFDDVMENLVDVQQKLKANTNINFTGYHCTFLEKLNNVLDPQIVKLQVDYLDKHEKWLSEDKAAKLIK